MTTDEDRDALAAEYALGTLDGDERAQAQALTIVDPAFALLVRQWERRLGELDVLVAPVEPPPATWEKIKAQIAGIEPSGQLRLPEYAAPKTVEVEPPAGGAAIVELDGMARRMRRWRSTAAIAGALAASLVGIVTVREVRPDLLPAALQPATRIQVVEKLVPSAQPAQFVAVFQKDDASPSFLLTVDVGKRTLTVRKVAAEQRADRSYELWIATQPGAVPRSLGVLGRDDFTIRATLAAYDPAVINSATYGISLEPLGGSPTGAPTGPVLHARLLQVTPAQNP